METKTPTPKASEVDQLEHALFECYSIIGELSTRCDDARVFVTKLLWENSNQPMPADVRKDLKDHGLLKE